MTKPETRMVEPVESEAKLVKLEAKPVAKSVKPETKMTSPSANTAKLLKSKYHAKPQHRPIYNSGSTHNKPNKGLGR
uniref:Uncharacterized protein n=1 Tax=Leersia perrieri TaxID=77586 RepID=A0A0D9WB65_9ORYZ